MKLLDLHVSADLSQAALEDAVRLADENSLGPQPSFLLLVRYEKLFDATRLARAAETSASLRERRFQVKPHLYLGDGEWLLMGDHVIVHVHSAPQLRQESLEAIAVAICNAADKDGCPARVWPEHALRPWLLAQMPRLPLRCEGIAGEDLRRGDAVMILDGKFFRHAS